jgi:hypothetical protein
MKQPILPRGSMDYFATLATTVSTSFFSSASSLRLEG